MVRTLPVCSRDVFEPHAKLTEAFPDLAQECRLPT